MIIERLSALIVDNSLGYVEKSKMEEWPRGLWRHLGKVVKGNLPWVRIPLLPPYRGFVQRLGLQSPKLSMGVRISHPLPIEKCVNLYKKVSS